LAENAEAASLRARVSELEAALVLKDQTVAASAAQFETVQTNSGQTESLQARIQELEMKLAEQEQAAQSQFNKLQVALQKSDETSSLRARVNELEWMLAEKEKFSAAQLEEMQAEKIQTGLLHVRVSELESALDEKAKSVAAELETVQAERMETGMLRSRVGELESALSEKEQVATELKASLGAGNTQTLNRLTEMEAALRQSREELGMLRVELETARATNSQAISLSNRVAELETALAEADRSAADSFENFEAARAQNRQMAEDRIADLENELASARQQNILRVAELESAQQMATARIQQLESQLSETNEVSRVQIAELHETLTVTRIKATTGLLSTPEHDTSPDAVAQYKRTEAILRQHEEDLAALLEFSPEAIGVVNTKTGLFENINSGAERLYGLSRDELLKVGPAQMSPEFQPDGRPSAEKAMEKIGFALHGGRPVFEWMHRNAQGQEILCEVSLVGLTEPRNHLVRFSVIDITERKRSQEALTQRATELEDARNSLDAIIENLPLMLFMKDAADLRFVRFNKAGEELIGMTRDDMLGKNDFDMFSHEMAEAFTAGDRAVLNGGTIVDIPEEKINTVHHGERILHTRKVPIYGLDGKPRYLLGVSEDITERKQAEQQLRLQALALETAANAIVITNQNGDIEWFNPAFTLYTGYTAEEAIGQNTRILKSGHHDSDFYKNIWETLLAGNVWQGEIVNRRKDGSLYREEQTITPVKDSVGSITHFVAVKQDVTIRHQQAEAEYIFEAAFRQSIEAAGAIPYRRDHRSNQYIYMGDGIQDILGYPPEEVTTTLLEALIVENHPIGEGTGLTLADAVQKVRGGQLKKWRSEMRILRLDGTSRWVGDASVEITNELGEAIGSMGIMQDITERKVAEQTLSHRATALATVAQVSIDAATILNPDELLQQIVDLTKSRLGLYHAHIYLLNEATEELVLTAGADEVGRQMVAAGRRIPLAQAQSLVARAARTHQGVIVNDVTADPGFLPNPLLPDTRSEMATPMTIGSQLLGVLDVQSNEVDRFTDEDVRIHTILAAQAAVALQNARQHRETENALRELDVLTRRLTREGWQKYSTTKQAHLSYSYDLNEVKPYGGEEMTSNGHAVIESPIMVRGESIGRLAIAESGQLDDETADIMSAVADRLSAHVDNLRLLEETERARVQLDRRALELEAIAKVSAAATTILDQVELLQTVVDLTKSSLDLYHVHIYLLSDDGTTLVLAAGSGDVGRKEVAAEHRIPFTRPHSLVARAARSRQGVLSNDVSKEPDFLPNPYLPDTCSEVAVPMIVADTLIGVFDVQSDVVNRFTDEDVQLKTTLAEQLAVALQNARFFQEQRATVERLRELDQLKSSFLANMSHELRTPLNSILGFAQVMIEGIDGEINETMENDLVIIQKNGQHLLNLISDILDMAKIEAGKMTLNPEIFDLKEVFDEVMDITGPMARAKTIDLIVDTGDKETLDLYADRVRLRQVMINLVNNAIKFTEKGAVEIRAGRTEAVMRISVKDSGIGIPATHLESIFQEFTQVDTSTTRKAGGTGLGLPISRHLIEMHSGRLWAESSGVPGEGSTLIMELPIETPYTS
jgi:PAS domain S-box-containing protein